MKYLKRHGSQGGMTLIELMVGIAIGLMTIAVAMGALIASRGVSGTITDASQLQQQASYAFRVMGQQFRQAGSLRLNLAPQKSPTATIDISDPVAFETKTLDFDPATNTLRGKDSPAAGEFKVIAGHRNYTEAVFPSASQASLFRDCLGEQNAASALIESRFVLHTGTGELRCNGQALVRNVGEFGVRYLLQANAATGVPTIQYVNATTAAAAAWRNVYAVEVCLVFYGDEAIQMPAGSTYAACDGTLVNMSNTGTLSAARKNRMHMAFRSVFQLRSQGLAG